jgi:hypothetical protein
LHDQIGLTSNFSKFVNSSASTFVSWLPAKRNSRKFVN